MLSNASPLHDTDMLYIVGAFIWTLSCHAGIFSEQHCQGEQKDYSYEMREDESMVFVERPNLKHAHDNRTDATSPRTVFLFHSALFFPTSVSIISVLYFDPRIDTTTRPQQ